MKIIHTNKIVILLFIAFAVLYVGFKMSPSSYSIVLKNDFQVQNTGLIWGTPREIRSDEWAHFTPWTQAVVNNDFKQSNSYSPYHENFRTVYPMPVFDWGLIFKPHMWMYVVLPPDFAFSFYWLFMMSASVIGFYFLFRQIGLENKFSIYTSLAIFFTGFFQYWWTANCGVMAFAPWVAWAVLKEHNSYIKFLLVFWVCLALLMALFYPPFLIQTAFFVFVVAIAFSSRPIKLNEVATVIAAACAAAAFGAWYYWDEILALANTVVPGDRRFNGGGMSFGQYVSHFFPAINVFRHDSLIGANVCEISVVGTWLPLLACFFLAWDKLGAKLKEPEWFRALFILLAAIILVSIWELLPIPEQLGRIFLWDRLHPSRMGFLSGLLWTMLAVFVMHGVGIRLNSKRVFLFGLVVVFAWHLGKVDRGIVWYKSLGDLSILFFVAALVLLAELKKLEIRSDHLALGAFAANMVAFGGFNPIQSTEAIFNRPANEVTKRLDKMLQEQGGEALAVPRSMGFPGAVLTGWGYPSIGHAMFAPHLEYWQSKFPEMNGAQIKDIFSRSGHIIVDTQVDVPTVLTSTVVAVPMYRIANESIRSVSDRIGDFQPTFSQENNPNGYVERISTVGNSVKIIGWAHWKGRHQGQRLVVLTNKARVVESHLLTIIRPDVAQYRGGADYLESGFEVRLTFEDKVDVPSLKFCLVAEDTEERHALVLNQVGVGFENCYNQLNK